MNQNKRENEILKNTQTKKEKETENRWNNGKMNGKMADLNPTRAKIILNIKWLCISNIDKRQTYLRLD